MGESQHSEDEPKKKSFLSKWPKLNSGNDAADCYYEAPSGMLMRNHIITHVTEKIGGKHEIVERFV